jgi:hypothetical protein
MTGKERKGTVSLEFAIQGERPTLFLFYHNKNIVVQKRSRENQKIIKETFEYGATLRKFLSTAKCTQVDRTISL